jgi:hypothetical protein
MISHELQTQAGCVQTSFGAAKPQDNPLSLKYITRREAQRMNRMRATLPNGKCVDLVLYSFIWFYIVLCRERNFASARDIARCRCNRAVHTGTLPRDNPLVVVATSVLACVDFNLEVAVAVAAVWVAEAAVGVAEAAVVTVHPGVSCGFFHATPPSSSASAGVLILPREGWETCRCERGYTVAVVQGATSTAGA